MTTPSAKVGRATVGFRSERGPILISLMLSTGLVAMDSTIIATAVPSIVGDLGGFAQFPWLFSVYLLAQAASVPIYGKLADLFGRKPILLYGIGVFLLGSVLCGTAWCMPALIAFRALQGLGAGAIQPMGMTIAGDIYSTAERGKVQGYLASVWATSAVVGPTLGGVFSEYLSWRWIFFVNVPLCVLAAWMLMRSFRERVTRREHRLDYAGAALLTVGCTLLILGLLEGGVVWPWVSVPGITVPLAGLAFVAAFVMAERRAAEPVLPLWVLRHRMLVTTCVVAVAVGAVVIGLTSYVPTFAQGVIGVGPLVAGFTVAAISVGWPLTSSQSSRIYLRAGFRATALVGSGLTILGATLTALLTAHATVWQTAGSCFITGTGLGFVAAPTLIAAQSTVGWSDRGVVTAANMFGRSIGSSIGAAVFGAIANGVDSAARLSHHSDTASGSGAATPAASVLARQAHYVFVGVAAVAVLLAVAVAMMPREAVQSEPAEPAELLERAEPSEPSGLDEPVEPQSAPDRALSEDPPRSPARSDRP